MHTHAHTVLKIAFGLSYASLNLWGWVFKPWAAVFLRMYQLFFSMPISVLLSHHRLHCTLFCLCDTPEGLTVHLETGAFLGHALSLQCCPLNLCRTLHARQNGILLHGSTFRRHFVTIGTSMVHLCHCGKVSKIPIQPVLLEHAPRLKAFGMYAKKRVGLWRAAAMHSSQVNYMW